MLHLLYVVKERLDQLVEPAKFCAAAEPLHVAVVRILLYAEYVLVGCLDAVRQLVFQAVGGLYHRLACLAVRRLKLLLLFPENLVAYVLDYHEAYFHSVPIKIGATDLTKINTTLPTLRAWAEPRKSYLARTRR